MPRPIRLPKDAKERVQRVLAYHQHSKLARQALAAGSHFLDLSEPPNAFRDFPDLPRVELPAGLPEVPADALAILRGNEKDLAQLEHCPQDLTTLATWLELAAGIRPVRPGQTIYRNIPSAGGLYPVEIYVAAFAIEGLSPGLYHFNPLEFHLRKLREGPETLARITRGRPDLAFLKTAPGAILVSTLFWRTAWKYEDRAYRYCLMDAGHMVQNLVTAAAGLGLPIVTRLRVNDNAMGELIGLRPDAPIGDAEAVQAMVLWAEKADTPMAAPRGEPAPLPVIDRAPLSDETINYPAILATHRDCVVSGLGISDIGPPHTDLNAVGNVTIRRPLEGDGAAQPSRPLRDVFFSRQSIRDFSRTPLAEAQLKELSHIAFRTGTFSPLRPSGPHVATVRPFWLILNVAGLQKGIWYHDPVDDLWSLLKTGDARSAARTICLEQPAAADCAALCFLGANLHQLMNSAGPDAYRLAHLEAGLVGQRLYLAATARNLGCCAIGAFYDDEARKFLGLADTNWEILYALAVGIPK